MFRDHLDRCQRAAIAKSAGRDVDPCDPISLKRRLRCFRREHRRQVFRLEYIICKQVLWFVHWFNPFHLATGFSRRISKFAGQSRKSKDRNGKVHVLSALDLYEVRSLPILDIFYSITNACPNSSLIGRAGIGTPIGQKACLRAKKARKRWGRWVKAPRARWLFPDPRRYT